MARSRRRLNASRRFATEDCLPSVIIGSTTRRSSFALGSVVLIISCRSSEFVMFRSIARRWVDVRLSFLSPCPWRMALSPDASGRHLLQAGRRPILQFHAERQPARGEHFLDLVQRLAAEVRGLEELGLGALDEVADVV